MVMKMEGEKRFALLLACRDSDYVKKVYGGYFNVFVDALGDEGERWDLFRVVEGEFPDMNELENYEAFLVSGSPYDAYGNEYWILKLCFLLQTLFAMQKKFLAFALAIKSLGGKVGKAYTGWDIGVRKVRILKELWPRGMLELDEIPPALSIIECHQDEVWEVPVGAEVIAFSDKTGVEMFTFGDNILGIQGHPEYTKDILNNLIERLQDSDSIEHGFGEDAKSKLLINDPDRKYWEMICKSFLKGRYN